MKEIRELIESDNLEDNILGIRILHEKCDQRERHQFFTTLPLDEERWIIPEPWHNVPETVIEIDDTKYMLCGIYIVIQHFSFINNWDKFVERSEILKF